jgi:hypothetical protein
MLHAFYFLPIGLNLRTDLRTDRDIKMDLKGTEGMNCETFPSGS